LTPRSYEEKVRRKRSGAEEYFYFESEPQD
jgi:hypothetical protein